MFVLPLPKEGAPSALAEVGYLGETLRDVHLVYVFYICVPRSSFLDDHYVEFSKLSQDRVIGTKDQVAHVRKQHDSVSVSCIILVIKFTFIVIFKNL